MKGEKTKRHGQMDHFRIVHRESNIPSKDHIKPIQLLREHSAKGSFLAQLKNNTRGI